jgi:hypothetical protein
MNWHGKNQAYTNNQKLALGRELDHEAKNYTSSP